MIMILIIIILSLLVIFLTSLSILLFWYNRQVVRKLLFVSDNIGDTMGLVKEFQAHLESLYEMEMFYGDSTLKGLIDHTKFIVAEIQGFEEIYSLTRPEDDQDDPDAYIYDTNNETEENQTSP